MTSCVMASHTQGESTLIAFSKYAIEELLILLILTLCNEGNNPVPFHPFKRGVSLLKGSIFSTKFGQEGFKVAILTNKSHKYFFSDFLRYESAHSARCRTYLNLALFSGRFDWLLLLTKTQKRRESSQF